MVEGVKHKIFSTKFDEIVNIISGKPSKKINETEVNDVLISHQVPGETFSLIGKSASGT